MEDSSRGLAHAWSPMGTQAALSDQQLTTSPLDLGSLSSQPKAVNLGQALDSLRTTLTFMPAASSLGPQGDQDPLCLIHQGLAGDLGWRKVSDGRICCWGHSGQIRAGAESRLSQEKPLLSGYAVWVYRSRKRSSAAGFGDTRAESACCHSSTLNP